MYLPTYLCSYAFVVQLAKYIHYYTYIVRFNFYSVSNRTNSTEVRKLLPYNGKLLQGETLTNPHFNSFDEINFD